MTIFLLCYYSGGGRRPFLGAAAVSGRASTAPPGGGPPPLFPPSLFFSLASSFLRALTCAAWTPGPAATAFVISLQRLANASELLDSGVL